MGNVLRKVAAILETSFSLSVQEAGRAGAPRLHFYVVVVKLKDDIWVHVAGVRAREEHGAASAHSGRFLLANCTSSVFSADLVC